MAVALLLTKKEPLLTSLLLVAFIAVAVVTVLLAARAQPPRLVALLNRHLESSAQLPVRVSLLFIVLLVLLAETLGPRRAARRVRRRHRGPPVLGRRGDRRRCEAKLEAIGFGFLIPIFFVVSGIEFDLHVFIDHPALPLAGPGCSWPSCWWPGACPVFLLYRRVLSPPERLPMALFSATGLPLIVVITSIALAEGKMLPVNAASLVAAGMLVGAAVPGHRARGGCGGGLAAPSPRRAETRARPGQRRTGRPEPSRGPAVTGVGRWTENQSRASR